MWSYNSTVTTSAITTASGRSEISNDFTQSSTFTGATFATSGTTTTTLATVSRDFSTNSIEMRGGNFSGSNITNGSTVSTFSTINLTISEGTGTSSMGTTRAFSFSQGSTGRFESTLVTGASVFALTTDGTTHPNIPTTVTVAGASGVTISQIRSFGATNSTVFSTFSSSGLSNAVFSSSSSTGSFSGTTLMTYNASTSAGTSLGTLTVSTTSTRTSVFPSSTAASATATVSSSDTVTSSVTVTATVSFTTYSTANLTPPVYLNTILEALSTDWVWKVTTTGADRIESNGSSITAATFTDQGTVVTFGSSYFNLSQTARAAITFTRPAFSSKTTSFTTRTSTTSTYQVARSSAGQSTPYTNTTVTVTVSYTSSRNTTLTYSSSSLSSVTNSSFNTFITVSSTASSVVPTSWANGTSNQTFTWLVPDTNGVVRTGSITFSALGGTAAGASTLQITTFSHTIIVSRSNVQSPGSSNMTVDGITIGEGFQATPSINRTRAIGTNISVAPNAVVASMGFGWLPSVRAPIIGTSVSSTTTVTTSTSTQDSTATTSVTQGATLAGTVPQTLRMTRSTSKFAGFGWISTDGVTATNTAGVHRMTTGKSSSTGTTERTWAPTASTHSFASGVGVAAETVPLVSSTLSNIHAPVTTFSAFPST